MVWLIMVALLFNGVLSGLSVDKVVVQLPARQRMGVVAYAAYARAADLGNGVALYAATGVGATVVTITAAGLALAGSAPAGVGVLLGFAAVLSVLHSAATASPHPRCSGSGAASTPRTPWRHC